jgi:hypothetical protein
MSWSERFVRDHRRRTDYAIHCAYAQLASDPATLEKFHTLLNYARRRAMRLFEAPVIDGRHAGVDALVHLSRFRDAHIRPMRDWAGTTASWRPAVSLLAQHLLCEYKVPEFLASAWYATDLGGDKKRGWFIGHARGRRFRSLGVPIEMTRKMEDIFLASQNHLPIEYAMRRAELLALGASAELVKAVMSTRLGADLQHGKFWRTVWIFLVANAHALEMGQIGPLIDYIQAVRHERYKVEIWEGMMDIDPPQPEFSMRGRTVSSILRLMQVWHRGLGQGNAAFSWMRSPFEPLLFEEPALEGLEMPRRWQMVELTDSAQLRKEGAALHHCVASYAHRCKIGNASIWSLRFWQGEKARPVLTVEVDPRRRAVVQARGWANRPASGKSLRLLRDWAGRERLQMSI